MLPAIENGFTFIAFLMFLAGGLLAMEKYTKWKVFNWVPPLVWIYILNMVFCTLGLYNSEGVSAAYGVLKNNLLYAMIFVMLLRCDFRKIAKLSGRMIAIFLGCSITLALGFIVGFPIFKGSLGGGETIWGATAALYASWVGGSANMAAMQDALPVDAGAYACALTLDTVCYSVWIALLLFAVKYAGKWNKSVKADTSKLEAVAAAANAEVANEKKQAKATDWIWLIGLALIVSALSQKIGLVMNNGLNEIGLDMFDKGTCTTLFVTVLGLVCAMTPLGKLPAVEDLSSVLLYAVVSLSLRRLRSMRWSKLRCGSFTACSFLRSTLSVCTSSPRSSTGIFAWSLRHRSPISAVPLLRRSLPAPMTIPLRVSVF